MYWERGYLCIVLCIVRRVILCACRHFKGCPSLARTHYCDVLRDTTSTAFIAAVAVLSILSLLPSPSPSHRSVVHAVHTCIHPFTPPTVQHTRTQHTHSLTHTYIHSHIHIHTTPSTRAPSPRLLLADIEASAAIKHRGEEGATT